MLASHSLLTIDQARRGQLLPQPNAGADPPTQLVGEEKVDRGSDSSSAVVHVVDNVLSLAECASVLRNATERFGLASIEHSYAATERQSDRLCILDEHLAGLIWQRLAPVHPLLVHHGPTGAAPTSRDGWRAERINECCRLSRYSAPSVGFKPHFDSPYVPSANERSALSVVLYLADVGSTDFYFPPTDGTAPTCWV